MKTLISIEEIKSTTLNENVEDKFILDAINTVQQLQLQQLIGTELLNKLLDGIDETGAFTLNDDYYNLVMQYIQPYLKKQVQASLIVPLNYKLRNAGLVTNTDNNFNVVGYKEAKAVEQYLADEASAFANLLTKYLCTNSSKFPEYKVKHNNNTNTIIYLG